MTKENIRRSCVSVRFTAHMDVELASNKSAKSVTLKDKLNFLASEKSKKGLESKLHSIKINGSQSTNAKLFLKELVTEKASSAVEILKML
jgi:hypothetical protein